MEEDKYRVGETIGVGDFHFGVFYKRPTNGISPFEPICNGISEEQAYEKIEQFKKEDKRIKEKKKKKGEKK